MEDDGLFRQEALRRFREGGTRGQVLRLAPGWTSWAVAALLLVVCAIAAWAARMEVDTRVRIPAEVVSNNDRGMRTIYLRAQPTPAQEASVSVTRGPLLLVFHPASGDPALPIGAMETWDDRHPGAVTIVANPAPPTLLPGTEGWVEVPTGPVPLLDVLWPERR
jgi:hypothetical protein